MGLDAQVIAVGDFSDTVLPALEYKSDLYTEVPLGATVIKYICRSWVKWQPFTGSGFQRRRP